MPAKFVFMGSPEFALPSLESLLAFAKAEGHEVIAVFTQPDRPSGRGQKLTPCAVAEKAQTLKLPLFQPKSLRKGEEAEQAIGFLEKNAPDLIIVVAYGLLLPARILKIPPMGCVNVHSSLLPRYRGAAPMQWAIANGETKTGVSTMLLNEAMDEGPILLQKDCSIGADEYADQLFLRLAKLGGELLRETLTLLLQKKLRPQPQDEKFASYAPLLKKSDAWINWNQPAQIILNRLRGFYPWPGAQTEWQGNLLKIHRAHLAPGNHTQAPGTVIEVKKAGLVVAAGKGTAICLTEVQLSGSKRQTVAEFLRGHPLQVGDNFSAPLTGQSPD